MGGEADRDRHPPSDCASMNTPIAQPGGSPAEGKNGADAGGRSSKRSNRDGNTIP